MHEPDLSADLEVALAAVHAAGAVIMEHFGRDEGIRYKSAEQPVTPADYQADRVLRDALLAARPRYGWLSEETLDNPARLARDRVWVVDPIDGTNSFIEHRPEFVVSVGLLHTGRPALGVILNPVTGETYYAVRDGGAFLDGSPIRVSTAPATDRPILLASRTEIAEGALAAYAEEWTITPLGSTAYRMVKVAEGVAHGTISWRTKHDWDVCGAAVIVTEAGGTVTDAHGMPLVFNRATPTHRGVVAAGPPRPAVVASRDRPGGAALLDG